MTVSCVELNYAKFKQFIPGEGITVFGNLLHTHLAGKNYMAILIMLRECLLLFVLH